MDIYKINQRLERDKQIIVKNILSIFEEKPNAIILCGGYGRGEGAWYEDDNGEIRPYNDYDIAVITECPFSHETYKNLRKKIANEIGIRWIDIDCYTKKNISRFKSTIHNIDLYEGSTLLWGDPFWSRGHKSLDYNKIGTYDLVKLYKTRMWTLLGSWLGDFRDLEGEEVRFFRNQMAKCVLASCDMRLIRLKKYNSSYRERVRLINEAFCDDERLCRLSNWAINEKLNPSSKKLSMYEMRQVYYEVYSEFHDSFSYAMNQKAKYFFNPDLTDSFIKYHTFHFIYLTYGKLRGIKDNLSKMHDVFLAQNYVLNAFSLDGNYNQQYIEKASDILKKWGFLKQRETDWNKIRFLVANARNNI